jgi:hypothetical protein
VERSIAKPRSAQAPRFIQLSPRSTNRVPCAIVALAKFRFAGRRPAQCARSSRLRRAAAAAGLALGDKASVRLTSRGDTDHARLVSSALALLYEYDRRED